jgi:hypothetical protein
MTRLRSVLPRKQKQKIHELTRVLLRESSRCFVDRFPPPILLQFLVSPGRNTIERPKVPNVGLSVIIAPLHFPTSDIELSVGPAIEAGSVGLTLVRKRPAHFPVPTSQQPGYQAADPAPPPGEKILNNSPPSVP